MWVSSILNEMIGQGPGSSPAEGTQGLVQAQRVRNAIDSEGIGLMIGAALADPNRLTRRGSLSLKFE